MYSKLLPITLIITFFFLLEIGAQQHSLIQYSVSEGLAQSEVTKFHQDSLGFLWMTTSGGGVSKFDGVNFENYNENNNLGGNIVTDITEGNNNTIYFASTWGAVSYFANNKITQLSDKETGIQHLIYDKKSETLFAAKDKTLFQLKDSLWETLPININQNIKGFFTNPEGGFYYYTENEIFTFETLHNKTKSTYKSDTQITTIYIDSNKDLIVATLKQGLSKITKTGTISFSFNKEFPTNIYISQIIQDLNHNLWFSTLEHGVFAYKDEELINITQLNGLPSNARNYLYCDNQNNIWIAVNGEGVFKHIKTPFVNYSNIEGLNKGSNFAIVEDSKGNLWTGTSSNGCYVYDGENVINYNAQNVLPSNTVFSIIKSIDQSIWIGTRGGIVHYKDGKFRTINASNGLVGNAVNYLYQDKQSRIWIATNTGLSFIKDGKITNYNSENGLSNESIQTIYEDHKGIMWFGTNDGLLKYYDGHFRKYNLIDGLCNSYVGSIIEDNNGVLWVGTDRCISKLVNEKFISYTEKDGLNSTIIYLMNKDDNGNLWIGTNKGLDRITLDEKSEIKTIDFFGKNEGFYGIESNTRGTYKDSEGDLYFATIKGIFKYQTKNNLQKEINYPLYFTSVKLFLDPVDPIYQFGETNAFNIADSLILPSNKNHLTFEFKGIDMTSSTDVSYSYKLENFDSTWFENTKSKYAVYSNLPPGEYTFKVKSQSKKSKSSPEFISCVVIIETPLPPFYFRWWFILLGTILVISIIYNLVFLRNKALRDSKEELEEKVKERTLEISNQNKEKTVLLQEIHHRVKNNLQIINSLFNIQAFYTTNEETKVLFKESQNRILSMSKIHQSLYESSDFSKLNIKTYITSLVNDIKESYSINDGDVLLDLNIKDNIKVDLDSLIPLALITNEIISNSFKYAFKNKHNNKIIINIKQDDLNNTMIKIEDNGVGLPSDFDWDNPTSMGVDLIKTLSDQLDGIIEVNSSDKGTSYLLTFVSK